MHYTGVSIIYIYKYVGLSQKHENKGFTIIILKDLAIVSWKYEHYSNTYTHTPFASYCACKKYFGSIVVVWRFFYLKSALSIIRSNCVRRKHQYCNACVQFCSINIYKRSSYIMIHDVL